MSTLSTSARERYRQGLRAAAFMPMSRIVAEAKAEAMALTLRDDVPQGPHVPADLKDEKGRFFSGSGYRIAGRMLTDDLLRGSPTPTAAVVLAMLPVLTLATLLLSKLGGIGTLIGIGALLAALWALNEAVQRRWVLIGVTLGIGVPLLLGSGFLRQTFPMLKTVGFGAFPLLMPIAIGLLVGTALVWFFAHDRRAAARFLSWSLGLMVAFALVSALLPPALQPLFWFGVGSLPALMYTRQQTATRAHRLARQGQLATLESTGRLRSSHVEDRKKQLNNALADPSTFVQLGLAKGIFTALHDGYSPDAGLPFGLTHNDLAQHLICMGASGTGKTGCVIRPILRSVLESRETSPIGLVVLDGKSSLAAELLGVPGYIYLEPTTGVALGLIEGLRPQAVIETLRDTRDGSRPDDTGGGEGGSYFTKAAETLLTHAAIILEALVQASKLAEATGRKRDWFWTIYDLHRIMGLVIAAGDKYEGSELAALMDEPGHLIHDFGDSSHARTELFVSAWKYMRESWAALEPKLRGSIQSTATQWYEPLLFDELLLPWVKTETGVDVTAVLKGGWLGVCMPTQRYGKRGRIVTAMVKRRIFNAVLDRDSDAWSTEPGATPVLFVVDEAQDVITQIDADFSNKCRSLGGRLVYAGQHFESFQAAFDRNEALAKKFLGDFASTIVFNSSWATYQWLSEGSKLGQVEAYTSSAPGVGIDFRFTAQLALSSPLLDPNHPMKDQMRALVRQGAGSVDESLLARRSGGEDSTQREMFDRPSSFTNETLRDLAIQPVMSGTWKTRPLLEPQEWAMYIKQAGVAVGHVQRGGASRHDLIECTYVSRLNVPKAA